MKLVWHIFKKDAYRLRWILALWLALPVVQMIYVGLAPLPSPQQKNVVEVIRYFFVLLTLIQAVVSYLLVMSLLDDDLLAGNQAFWPTRPISGRQLLGAKLIGLVVLLWLAPVAVLAPWWLAHGYGWHELGKAAGGVVLTQAVITLLALPLAALSPRSGVFLVLSGVGLLSNLVGVVAVFNALRVSSEVQESRGYLCMAIWLATVTGVTAHQFLTRRTLRSAALFVVGWAGIFCVLGWWPWDFASKITWSHESPLAANLTLEPQSALVSSSQRGMTTYRVFNLNMQLAGLPGPYTVVIDSAQHTFSWGGEISKLPLTRFSGTGWFRSEFDRMALAVVLDDKSIAPMNALHTGAVIEASALAERLLREAPAYRGVLRGRIFQPVVVADLPLRVGESAQRSGYGVCIEAVQPKETGGIQFVVRVFSAEAEPASIIPWTVGTRSSTAVPEYNFVVNRRRGSISLLNDSEPEMLGCIGTLGVYRQRFDYGAADEECRLVKVVFRPVAVFERTISSPRMEITPLSR